MYWRERKNTLLLSSFKVFVLLYFVCRDSRLCEISLQTIKLLIVVENVLETYSGKKC